MAIQNSPPINHKQLPPEEWQRILHQAIQDFHADRSNLEAWQAIHDATDALKAYDMEQGSQTGDLGPVMTGLQKAGETAGSMAQFPISLATHVAQSLTTSPKNQATLGQAGEDIANAVDPNTYLSPQEQELVA